MTAMAASFIPLNGGAIGFLVYAAAAGGFTPTCAECFVLIAP